MAELWRWQDKVKVVHSSHDHAAARQVPDDSFDFLYIDTRQAMPIEAMSNNASQLPRLLRRHIDIHDCMFLATQCYPQGQMQKSVCFVLFHRYPS